MYINAAYCYRQSSIVCGWSICDSREPCKNCLIEMPFGLCTLVDVRKPVLDGGVHIGATWQI